MEFLGILLLATLIEGLITYLFGEGEATTGKSYLRYVSLVLGIGASIAYSIDIPQMAGLVSPYPFISYVVSGLIIGRGANYLNDIMKLIQSK